MLKTELTANDKAINDFFEGYEKEALNRKFYFLEPN